MATEFAVIENGTTTVYTTLADALNHAGRLAKIRVIQSNGDVLSGFIDLCDREYYAQGKLAWDIQGGTVGNCAAGNGGLVVAQQDSALNGVSFQFNAATVGNGGAVFQSAGCLRVSGAEFIANSAVYNGGAIFSTEGVPLLAGSYFEGNSAMFGGGLFVNTAENSSTIVRGCYFFHNAVTNYGGAIYVNSSPLPVSVENTRFFGNTAGYGGGVFLERGVSGGGELIGCLFVGNTAAYDGGALYTNVTTTVADSVFMHNASVGNGGAMLFHGGVNTIVRDSFFQENVSAAAGVVYVGQSVSGMTFSGTEFDRNFSQSEGGAVYNTSQSPLLIRDAVFSGNTAVGQGGGMFSISGAVRVENSVWQENCARDGAALSLASGSAVLRGTAFLDNCASSRGGAVASGGRITVEDCVFSGNTGSYGAALCISSTSATDVNDITGSTFSGNTGSEGVIYVEAAMGELNFDRCVFSDNRGWALNNLTAQNVTVTDTLFRGNTVAAAYGGALINYGTIAISGGTFAAPGDLIYNIGTVRFAGRNLLGADITSYGTLAAHSAELVFVNAAAIALPQFTVDGTLALTFSGRNTVNFSNWDLSALQPVITVTTAGLPSAGSLTVASGLLLDPTLQITVENRRVGLNESFTIGGIDYTTMYQNGELTVSRTSGYDTVYAVLDGSTVAVVNGNTVALAGQPVFPDCASAKAALNTGGVMVVVGETAGAFPLDETDTILTACAVGAAGMTFTTVDSLNVSVQYGTPLATVRGGTVRGAARIAFADFAAAPVTELVDVAAVAGTLELTVSGGAVPGAVALLGASVSVGGDLYCTLRETDFGGAVTLGGATVGGAVCCTVESAVFRSGVSVGGAAAGGGTTFVLKDSAALGGGITVAGGTSAAPVGIVLHGATAHRIGRETDGGPLTLEIAASSATSSVGGSLAGVADQLVIRSAAGVNFTTPQDLSGIHLTVDGGICDSGAIVIASGVTGVGDCTIIGGTQRYGLMLMDRKLYLVKAISATGDETANYLTGGTINLVTGGTIGGCFVGTNGDNFENVLSVITGGVFIKPVIGGSLVRQTDPRQRTGDVTLDISGGDFRGGKLYAAGYAYGIETVSRFAAPDLQVGDSALRLAGTTIAGDIYAGAHARRNGLVTVRSSAVAVESGVYGSVYGGGWAERNSVSLVGGATIDVSGGKVECVYAGGGNAVTGCTRVSGDVVITVRDSGQADYVFLGGRNKDCYVDGDVTLTLSGDAKTLIRISGWNANGSDCTAGLTTLNVDTDVTVACLDHVDRINITPGCRLNVTGMANYENPADLTVNFRFDSPPQKAWTALAGEGLELFQGANFQINGVDCAWSPDDGRLGDSGCALIFDDADKSFIISKLA